jgi:hypothetical protein
LFISDRRREGIGVAGAQNSQGGVLSAPAGLVATDRPVSRSISLVFNPIATAHNHLLMNKSTEAGGLTKLSDLSEQEGEDKGRIYASISPSLSESSSSRENICCACCEFALVI